MNNNQVWKSDLDFYEDIRALTFDSQEGIDAAIGLLWTKDLRECPHDLAARYTIIVPAEAVPYFRNADLSFTENEVMSSADLSEDELKEIRGATTLQ